MNYSFTVAIFKQEVKEGGFHIFTHSYVKDKKINLLIDTGASRTVFDTELLKQIFPKLSLEENEEPALGIGSQSVENQVAKIPYFAIGGLVLDGLEIGIIDLKGINQHYSQISKISIDGILGGDILNTYNALIDYKNCTMKFFK